MAKGRSSLSARILAGARAAWQEVLLSVAEEDAHLNNQLARPSSGGLLRNAAKVEIAGRDEAILPVRAAACLLVQSAH